jgi:CheY-like chemotaxis protein
MTQRPEEGEASKALKNGSQKRILIVDDNRLLAFTLDAILRDEGYDTAVAYSGEEAIRVASSFKPDLLLSDVMMGGMNGVEAALEILRTLPNCKVLFMSGRACTDVLQDARSRGFNFQLLCKPIPAPILLEKISAILSDECSSAASAGF